MKGKHHGRLKRRPHRLEQRSLRALLEPHPGHRIALLKYTTENNTEITMIMDNGSNEYWLQIISNLFDTADAQTLKTAAWHLRHNHTIGITQLGDSDTIHLPHANLHAITNGINMTALATETIHNNTNT